MVIVDAVTVVAVKQCGCCLIMAAAVSAAVAVDAVAVNAATQTMMIREMILLKNYLDTCNKKYMGA